MRCFIGIPIPEGIRRSIMNYVGRIQSTLSGVKWVKEENLHITLRFLGGVDEAKIESIKKVVEETSRNFSVFSCQLTGTGYFPSPRRAKVIWIGVKEGGEELSRISRDLENRIIKLGFNKEKPFHPHLTIGRIKGVRTLNIPDYRNGTFTVHEVVLYQSTLTPQGPIYDGLFKAELKKG